MTDSLDLGGLTLSRTAHGNVILQASTMQQAVALQHADLPAIVAFLQARQDDTETS